MVAYSCHRDFVIFSAFVFYMNGFSYFILFILFYFPRDIRRPQPRTRPRIKIGVYNWPKNRL